jgi:hypothetical protein
MHPLAAAAILIGPQILQIYRDSMKDEAAFRTIEEEAARICAELSCPHAHLAIESLSGPKEVWWLNFFESEADRAQVTADYEKNPPLVAALGGITSKRTPAVIGDPVDLLASYRADLSGGLSWNPVGARFFAATLTRSDRRIEGAAFEAPDGTRFYFRPARTLEEAEALAKAAGASTRVFAVRPYWGMPAKEWILADPEFWKSSPSFNERPR